MIKINLLPGKRAKKQGAGQKQLAIFLLIYIAVVAILFVFYQQKKSQIYELQQERMKAEKEIANNKGFMKQLEKFKSEEAKLKQKLVIIRNLRKNKETPTVYLAEISRIIPKKVWLNQFTNQAGIVTISGYSTEYQSIATFMASLEESPMFTNVQLANIKGHQIKLPSLASKQIHEFKITCNLTEKAKKG